MSELKWNWVYYPYLDAPNKQEESALKAGYIKVVSKDEADKVIAEKDKEIGVQKRLRDMALASVPNVLKVMKIIQHHKYKRCLAMARWCEFYADSLRVKRNQCRYDEAEIAETYYIRCRRYRRWCKVWLELAEKFK